VTLESILDKAASVSFRRLKRVGDDPRKLPAAESTLVVVYGAQGVIDNGGFRYFFENDWSGRPPYSLFSDAYRQIGSAQTAALLDRAVSLFPFPRPHLASRKRNQFMDSLPEDHELFALGDRVCGDQTVWQNLERYVTNNLAAFEKRPNKRMQLTRSALANGRRGPRS
jgi:uncharacterized protein DUF4375